MYFIDHSVNTIRNPISLMGLPNYYFVNETVELYFKSKVQNYDYNCKIELLLYIGILLFIMFA